MGTQVRKNTRGLVVFYPLLQQERRKRWRRGKERGVHLLLPALRRVQGCIPGWVSLVRPPLAVRSPVLELVDDSHVFGHATKVCVLRRGPFCHSTMLMARNVVMRALARDPV